MTSLKDVLKRELSKPKFKDMTPVQIVTYLNARRPGFSKTILPKGKGFSVEPTFLLSKAGIDPKTINTIFGFKKTKGYLKSFLSKPVKYEEFDYWRGIIDWLATTKMAWFRRKKLLSAEQSEALKKAFDEVVVQRGGVKTEMVLGPIRIKELTGGKVTAILVKDIEEVVGNG